MTAARPSALRVREPGTEYRIDPVSLRATAVDPTAMEQVARRVLAESAADPDPSAAAGERSLGAYMLLLAGRPSEAEPLLRGAISVQDAVGSVRARLSSELRLVQVLQQLNRLPEALALARDAATRSRQHPELMPAIDFALHHLGKVYLQMGFYHDAQAVLAEALALRVARGDAALVRSTELALAAVQRRRGRA